MRFRSLLLKLALTALLSTQIACQGENRTIILEVETKDVTKKIVPFVEVKINNATIGMTNEEGKYKGEYDKAKIGEELNISFSSTREGYQEVNGGGPRNLKVEADSSFMGMLGKAEPILVEIKDVFFERPKQPYLFIVEGDPNTDILIESEPIAEKIKEDGYAIVLYEAIPGKPFTIQVGKLTASGTFSENKELYLITSQRQEALADPSLLTLENSNTETAKLEVPSAPVKQEEPIAKLEVPTPKEEISKPIEEEAPALKPIKASKVEQPTEEAPVLKPMKEKAVKAVAPVEEENSMPMPIKSKKVEKPAEEETDFIPPPTTTSKSKKVEVPVEEESDFIPPPTKTKSLPQPEPVAVTPTPTPKTQQNASGPSIQDLLKSKNAKPTSNTAGPTEAPIEDEDVMASNKSKSTAPVMGSTASALDAVPKETVVAEVDRIVENYDRTKVLRKQDIDYLKQVTNSHGSAYQESNRVLGEFYYSIKETTQQISCLEIATKQGKYKKDPRVLLSLAQAYTNVGKYQDGLDTMKKLEPVLNRLAGERANAHQTYAEMYKFAYMSIKSKNPRQANPVYLDNAIEQWKKYEQVGGDSGKAQKQIQQLESIKADGN